jgi:Spy/CpxP family protein refolding chaperone
MKVRWLALSMAAALCLAPFARTAWTQERPAPAPEQIGEGVDAVPGDSDGMNDLDDLDLLLAADVAGGPGHAPDPAMGPGGMGRGGPGGPGMRRGAGGMGREELREQLNLTDDQKSKLADIRDRQVRAAIPIEADLRIAGLDLRKLLRAERPNQQAIDAQIDRVAGLRARLQKSHVASMLEARAVLTPAQQKLLREHRGGMMGRGMHGGPRMRMMDEPLTRPRR